MELRKGCEVKRRTLNPVVSPEMKWWERLRPSREPQATGSSAPGRVLLSNPGSQTASSNTL